MIHLNDLQLHVVGNSLHQGKDFMIKSTCKSLNPDYLLFFDSRGISKCYHNSLADRLISHIEQLGKSYLLICRPLELTIWASFLNFMNINQINPGKIILNMGFVDFTPKKLDLLQDTLAQVEYLLGDGVAKPYFVEDYTSTQGIIQLYSVHYGESYGNAIEAISANHSIVIINSPPVKSTMKLERKRPSSFYNALSIANDYNHSLNGPVVIDFPNFPKTHTYDAVHYTDKGNTLISTKVASYI